MFLARMVFFRLHESPRYLVHAGRPLEAIESLQMISKFNGSELFLDPEDVDDTVPASGTATQTSLPNVRPDEEAQKAPTPPEQGNEALRSAPPDAAHYSSVGEPDVSLGTHQFGTPLNVTNSTFRSGENRPPSTAPALADVDEAAEPLMTPRPRVSRAASSTHRRSRRMSSASEYIESKGGPVFRALPRWVRRSALAWIDRVAMVLSPEWIRTTLLVWAAWCGMSLGKSSVYCQTYVPSC